ncbi:MAG: hypothetical protein OSB18_01565 [SAR324 cluster bacterium]|nr:hypothetical protein [SAR324 cluster bacterium]
MNPLTHSHSFLSLFVSSFRLYRKHFLPMVLLTGVLLIPSMLLSIGGLIETESVLFMLMMHILEGAIALGVVVLAFQGGAFPTLGILNIFRSRVFFGAMHIAVLQYMLFLFGVIGMTLPFPINVMMVSLWLFSLFAFSLAQPVYMVEQVRGLPALARSFQLVRTKLSRVSGVVVTSTALQFLLMWVLLQAFLPELDFELNPDSALEVQIIGLIQNEEVKQAIHWAKYLTALFFFPFAALLSVLLYFDLAHQESGFQLEQLEQLSQRWFGPPSQAAQTDPEPPEHPEGGEQ